MSSLEEIKKEEERWYDKNIVKAKRKPQPRKTTWGTDLDIIYTPADFADRDYMEDLGFSGEYPFTRGIQASMYRGRMITMRNYAGFGNPEETNVQYKRLLKQGQSGLSMAFDLPTQLGYDSDNPLVEEEVGRVGVAVDSLKDYEIIFDGIPLDKITTSMTLNPVASVGLAMYMVAAEKQGVTPDKIGGTLQNDILKEYLSRGTAVYPAEPSLRLIGDIMEYCYKNVPKFNTVSICGYHMREAGCGPVQEVAYMLSDAITYIDEALSRGLDIDDFAPRLSFLLANGMNLFEETAKFRAARRLYAKIIKNKYHAKNPRSMLLRMFCGCTATSYTDREPLNNIARGTIMTLQAFLSGAQAVHTTHYNEAYSIPTEETQRTALRTQQIVAYETDAAAVVDPLGGSYYVEHLTNELEKKIEEEMARIEERGGMVKGITDGSIQRDIAKQAYEDAKRFETGEKIVVGVNKFRAEGIGVEQTQIHKPDPNIRARQLGRLEEIKSQRDNKKVKETLDAIRAASKNSENLMPLIVTAVREYATLGEISGIWREEWGRYKEVF